MLTGVFVACNDKYSRKELKTTTKLNDYPLYVETYLVYGSGAFGTDIVSEYLTDSATFRKYIGTFDEGPEYYYYKISKDTVYIEKYRSFEGKEPKKLLEKNFLSISELKKMNNVK